MNFFAVPTRRGLLFLLLTLAALAVAFMNSGLITAFTSAMFSAILVSGFVMAFTLSLDDFVISYFVGSSKFQTLPLLIYSMTKKKVTPDMYALSTLIIITIFALLIFSNVRSGREEERRKRKAARK